VQKKVLYLWNEYPVPDDQVTKIEAFEEAEEMLRRADGDLQLNWGKSMPWRLYE
jgi:hypothetical protein